MFTEYPNHTGGFGHILDNSLFISAIAMILLWMLIVWSTHAFQKRSFKEGFKDMLHIKTYFDGYFFSIMSITVLVLFGYLLVTGQLTSKTHYYQGDFKVADTMLDATTDDSDNQHKIVLEDNKGNKQMIKLPEKSPAVHKGDKVNVKVRVKAWNQTKPSLKRSLDSESMSIESVEKTG